MENIFNGDLIIYGEKQSDVIEKVVDIVSYFNPTNIVIFSNDKNLDNLQTNDNYIYYCNETNILNKLDEFKDNDDIILIINCDENEIDKEEDLYDIVETIYNKYYMNRIYISNYTSEYIHVIPPSYKTTC